MKVTLRKKKITGGRQTLYLDFYPPIPHPTTGEKTRREFLKLYVYDRPNSAAQREHNKETLLLAENVRAQRQIKIQAGNFGFMLESKKKEDFIKYYEDLCGKRNSSKGNHNNWQSSLNYFKAFTGSKCLMEDVTEKFCNDFRVYLLSQDSIKYKRNPKRLSQNAAHSYFNKFRAAVAQAFQEKMLEENPCLRVKGIKQTETDRAFLTIEELNKLVKTPCELPQLKQAALFSALTGLRWIDIKQLTWDKIRHSKAEGYTIHFRQKKTGGFEVHNISDQAYGLLGDRRHGNELVFPSIEYSAWMLMKLKDWLTTAEIYKKITFHNFRHTYATLQLSEGTDIYTVSKMLGHRNVKTTQVYTKVVDKLKIAAANKIKLDI
jgi:site-specific recombinase XerD